MLQKYFNAYLKALQNEHYHELEQLELKVPEHFNWVRDVFEAIHVHEHPERTMLELIDEDGIIASVSYHNALQQCNRLLNYLRASGVQKGDTVCLLGGLHASLWVSYLAIIKGGFVLMPAANILSAEDIAYRFKANPPRVIISDEENHGKINEAEALAGMDAPVKLLMDHKAPDWHHFDVVYQHDAQATAADTLATDTLFLFFTSGTTGMPKIAAHTHSSYPLGHLTTAAWIGLKPGDKHYNISQPGWAKFSWSSFFAPLNVGATIFSYKQEGRFNAAGQLAAISKYKITTLCCPPTALRQLVQEDLAAYKFNLRQCVSAGEPLNPEVIEAWQRGTGHLIRDGFGQTESTCMVCNLPGDKVKFGSMGKPAFLYDIVIADDDGNILPPHEEGQIAVRMKPGVFNGIFKEYLGMPEKTAEVFKHGLYYTGDKAFVDEEGYIWFVGRNDDVIKSSDYRVGPFEVESVLIELDEVLESAVVGSPHPMKTAEVKAYIILHPDAEANENLARKIFNYCREHMAPYKMPRIIEFVKELPKTISGKIRRMELRAAEVEKKAKGAVGEQEYFYK